MTEKSEKYFVVYMLSGLAVLFGYFALTWEGFEGGADNMAHYRISRYAFNYPHLFLDHWGKPFFTLLSSPFAQFGFTGIRFFNILTGLLAAFFTYLSAKKFEMKNPILAIVFTVFAPIYFILLPTGLTEPLFSLLLILSVYLMLSRRYVLSAIVISFLPLVRTEGLVILPLFFLALITHRKYMTVFLLVSGPLIYSIIGYFYFGDFFWLITHSPYGGAKDIYGSGDFFRFVKSAGKITGIPEAVLIGVGIIGIFKDLVSSGFKSSTQKNLGFFLLVAAPLLIYLAAHSYVWWKGIGGSLGLIRVMAGIIPLASLLALKGYNTLMTLFKIPGKAVIVVSIALSITIAYYPLFKYHDFPLNESERTVAEAASWLRDSEHFNYKIYYYHLYFIHYLGIDPFNTSLCQEKIPDRNQPSHLIPEGSIIQWDSHFGPNEGRLPLENLINDPNLVLLKTFEPKVPVKTWKGDAFRVHLFIRTGSE
ncbi:MAG: hypothetical protein ACNA7V_09035 [Bacteroidales bacterium]